MKKVKKRRRWRSYLVMKSNVVEIVQEVKRSDSLWRFLLISCKILFGNNSFLPQGQERHDAGRALAPHHLSRVHSGHLPPHRLHQEVHQIKTTWPTPGQLRYPGVKIGESTNCLIWATSRWCSWTRCSWWCSLWRCRWLRGLSLARCLFLQLSLPLRPSRSSSSKSSRQLS